MIYFMWIKLCLVVEISTTSPAFEIILFRYIRTVLCSYLQNFSVLFNIRWNFDTFPVIFNPIFNFWIINELRRFTFTFWREFIGLYIVKTSRNFNFNFTFLTYNSIILLRAKWRACSWNARVLYMSRERR